MESVPPEPLPKPLVANVEQPIADKEEPQNKQVKAAPSLFDYRLGVMKYANPLRAKILIFSALNSDFKEGDHNWFNLKTYDLDGLIRRLLSVCKSYTDMEVLLYSAARRFKESDTSIQTASAVIRCLRPFYIHHGASVILDGSAEGTQVSLDDFEETTLEIGRPDDEPELTCQLLLSAPSLTRELDPPDAQTENTSFLQGTGHLADMDYIQRPVEPTQAEPLTGTEILQNKPSFQPPSNQIAAD